MGSSSSGTPTSLATIQSRTKYRADWVQWQIQHGSQPATRIATFEKEGRRLVVYAYGPNGNQCVLISSEPQESGPPLRKFRSWKQSFHRVSEKLKKSGWHEKETLREVSHAH